MTEKIMTGMLLGTFVVLVFVLNFVDSVTTESGKIYYGIVTSKGLYNPQFAKSNIPGDLRKGDSYFTGADETMYKVNLFDFINGMLDVIAFATLSLLAAPITTCFYPNIPDTVMKTAPILVSLLVGAFFVFAPPGRHGVGFEMSASGFQLVPETHPEALTRQVSQRNIDTTNTDHLLHTTVASPPSPHRESFLTRSNNSRGERGSPPPPHDAV